MEMTLIASLTNGPGTISAQGAKLSASAGNRPHTAMIATLASIGTVHGGNGSDAVKLLLEAFAETGLEDPYTSFAGTGELAARAAADYKRRKEAAQEAGLEYERIPCLGHPVFRDQAVNYDPRERVIAAALQEAGRVQRVPGLLPRPGPGPQGQRRHAQRAGGERGRGHRLRLAGDLLEAPARKSR